jgi:NAD(P)H-dependent flavin oxidoreductase YrpB (nitropropane dioxygenase family)
MFKTKMTEILGIDNPIQCGTMMALTTSEMVGPVAESGCLCCFPSAFFNAREEILEEVKKIRDLTDKPFGANLNLFPHFGDGPSPDDRLEWLLEAGVPIIETSGGNPTPYRERIASAGVKHIHKVARVRDAIKAEKAGVDIISVVGTECGGHPSLEEVGFIILIPAALDVLKTPLIAGGGICDGRTFLSALALGACGVNIGTRFMNTREFPIHENFKNRVLDTEATETILTMKSLGNPCRAMKTSWTENIVEMEKNGATLEELFPLISGAVSREGWDTGDVEKGMYAFGQAMGRIHDIPTVQELVDRLLFEAHERRDQLNLL